MGHSLDMDALTRATRRREFEDGLGDFAVGGIFLLLGALDWFIFSTSGLEWYARALAQHRGLTYLGLAILAVILIGGPIAARKAIQRIRLAESWRSRGYVVPLRLASRPTIVASALVTIGILLTAARLLAAGRIEAEVALQALVVAAGIGTAIVYFGLGLTLELTRYLVVGLVGAIISLAILPAVDTFSQSWLLLGVGWAALLASSGLWALRQTIAAKVQSASG